MLLSYSLWGGQQGKTNNGGTWANCVAVFENLPAPATHNNHHVGISSPGLGLRAKQWAYIDRRSTKRLGSGKCHTK